MPKQAAHIGRGCCFDMESVLEAHFSDIHNRTVVELEAGDGTEHDPFLLFMPMFPDGFPGCTKSTAASGHIPFTSNQGFMINNPPALLESTQSCVLFSLHSGDDVPPDSKELSNRTYQQLMQYSVDHDGEKLRLKNLAERVKATSCDPAPTHAFCQLVSLTIPDGKGLPPTIGVSHPGSHHPVPVPHAKLGRQCITMAGYVAWLQCGGQRQAQKWQRNVKAG